VGENPAMADLLTLADRLFTGAEPVTREKLFAWSGELALVFVAQSLALVAFALINATAIAAGAWFGPLGWPTLQRRSA